MHTQKRSKLAPPTDPPRAHTRAFLYFFSHPFLLALPYAQALFSPNSYHPFLREDRAAVADTQRDLLYFSVSENTNTSELS